MELIPFDSAETISSKIGDISEYWANKSGETNFDNIIDCINYNAQWVIENFQRKPVTIWQTDGTTGLLGVNDSTMNLTSWQLENLDFTPYKYVIA